jgi:hypothetical protein
MAGKTDATDARPDALPLVIGVADHCGWAILVSASWADGHPAVVDRRRVRLIETGLPSQPYEHETRGLREEEAEQLLRRVTQSIERSTALALDRLAADLRPLYRVSGLAMRQPPLGRLPASAEHAHRSYHVLCRADAMLYHSAICAAARQRRWPLAFHRRGEELARAAQALQWSPPDVERFMTDLRTALQPPWTAEHRRAFAAAIAALGAGRRVATRAGAGKGGR